MIQIFVVFSECLNFTIVLLKKVKHKNTKTKQYFEPIRKSLELHFGIWDWESVKLCGEQLLEKLTFITILAAKPYPNGPQTDPEILLF